MDMILCRSINSPTLVSKTIVGQKPEEQKKNAIFQVFFKPRFINKQVKSLKQNTETTFKMTMSFSGRNMIINANFGALVYITLQKNCEAEVDR